MSQQSEFDLESIATKFRLFCEERGWDPYHNPKNLAIGVVTEASELLELFRFVDEKDVELKMESVDFRKRLGEELADTLFFILRFAQKYSVPLRSEMERKLKMIGEKYPIETNSPKIIETK